MAEKTTLGSKMVGLLTNRAALLPLLPQFTVVVFSAEQLLSTCRVFAPLYSKLF